MNSYSKYRLNRRQKTTVRDHRQLANFSLFFDYPADEPQNCLFRSYLKDHAASFEALSARFLEIYKGLSHETDNPSI